MSWMPMPRGQTCFYRWQSSVFAFFLVLDSGNYVCPDLIVLFRHTYLDYVIQYIFCSVKYSHHSEHQYSHTADCQCICGYTFFTYPVYMPSRVIVAARLDHDWNQEHWDGARRKDTEHLWSSGTSLAAQTWYHPHSQEHWEMFAFLCYNIMFLCCLGI